MDFYVHRAGFRIIAESVCELETDDLIAELSLADADEIVVGSSNLGFHARIAGHAAAKHDAATREPLRKRTAGLIQPLADAQPR